jgi:hypothetical protein
MLIKKGIVKFAAGKEFKSNYSGEMQQNIAITLEDGTEEKIYFKSGRYPHSQLKKGQPVQVVYEEKKIGGQVRTCKSLVADADKPVSTEVPASAPSAKTVKSARDFVKERAAIMGEIMTLVSKVLPNATPEDLRAISSGILIEGSRQGVQFIELLKATIEPEADDLF